MPAFWKLSLCGNILLLIHAVIQIQFHVAIVQTCNAVISWRNLNLMQPLNSQKSTRQTIHILIATIFLTFLVFVLQDYLFFQGSYQWFRIPATPWQIHIDQRVSLAWHLLGFLGLILFSSRFWIQWWDAERSKRSFLGTSFWWISLVGEGLCLTYFLRIHDPVNFLGPAFGIIPYVRNLMLIYRKRRSLGQGGAK